MPINSPAAIEQYTVAAASEAARAKDEAQQRQLAAVKRDLAELKVLMTELSPHENEHPAARDPLPVRATAATRNSVEASTNVAKFRRSEKIHSGEQSTLFTITLSHGKTKFVPSAAFRRALLTAATKSTRIKIRGAADVTKATDAGESIARARGENARKYLLDNGIDPVRITIIDPAAELFNADNATTDGKTRKRCVEIEVMAPVAALGKAKDGQSRGAMQ